MLKDLVKSLRPFQWYKNLVIFVGIVFSAKMFDISLFLNVVYAFIVFCMVSGALYIINDVLDIKSDKLHPKKSKRPIASGKISLSIAYIFSSALFIIGLLWAYKINPGFLLVLITYIILIFIYSIILKNIVIVDILVIAIGFVIRAIAGAVIIKEVISPWLIICTFLLALFLALGKRKHELSLLDSEAKNHRKNLEKYSLPALSQMINITMASLLMSYLMYSFLSNNYYMILTIPFPVYGFFKYLILIEKENFGGEPEKVFKDKGILLSILFWIIVVVSVLYFI